ncbi:sulfotransferase family protein [Tahibacter amnicola]|uniref:Sulfotransferase n=1 Tax=Tahibacter amnicola TaxID=2976241 RepID=A0ABY6BGR6_9GAMM|nr:sulfotransferase [Tahibacter amnicola]UXI69214.1 sulfotransferase [Tahibacter amnicola]
MQVFVCGMHRSGTSMVARLLNLMGMYFGPEGSALPVNRENPKGFWERRDIVELNDRLLAATGSTWFDIHRFLGRSADWQPPPPLREAVHAKVLDIDAYRPWFLKDPRLCLTLDYWREWCERPVAVICSRDPRAIVASLAKRSEITGLTFTTDEAVALWLAYNAELMRASEGMPRIFVRYEDFLAQPQQQCRQLYEALVQAGVRGLHMPDDHDIAAFVDPSLHRSASARAIEGPLAQIAAALDATLSQRTGGESAVVSAQAAAEHLAGLHERLEQARRHRKVLAALSGRIPEIEANVAAADGTVSLDEPWTLHRLRHLRRPES